MFQALGKQPVIHRPELHRRQINSQTIVDVNNYITADIINCEKYRHIRNYYLSNSKTFQDGNGNGTSEEINSNDFLDGNWESMEIKGRLRGPRR